VTPTEEALASSWALQRMRARAALIWALVSGFGDNMSKTPLRGLDSSMYNII
jgi:hypothetical protein